MQTTESPKAGERTQLNSKRMNRLIRESHRRQFNGEDWQAVSIDIAEDNGIKFEDDEFRQLNSSPEFGCDCGFCEDAPWIDSDYDREPIMDNPGYRRCNCEDYPCCGH